MPNLKRSSYRRILTLTVLYAGFFIFLFTTDPRKLAVGWLILPFILLFVSLYLTVIYVIDWLAPNHSHSRRQMMIAILLAGVPSVMLILDSVDQLTARDALLIVALAIISLFYVNKISLKHKNF